MEIYGPHLETEFTECLTVKGENENVDKRKMLAVSLKTIRK